MELYHHRDAFADSYGPQLHQMDPRQAPSRAGWSRPLVLLLVLVGVLCSCSELAFAQTIAERAKVRGDSILAVAKCWRAVRPLPAGTTLSACPDSLEAARVAHVSPLARATAAGVLIMAVEGDTLTVRAIVIGHFVFVGPAHGSGLGVIHTDALVTAAAPGLVPITVTLNGVRGMAALLVIPRQQLQLVELPRVYLDTRMPAMPLSGDTIFVGAPGTPFRCVHNATAVPCP